MRTSLLNGRYPPTDWRVQVCVGDGIPADPFITFIILFFFSSSIAFGPLHVYTLVVAVMILFEGEYTTLFF